MNWNHFLLLLAGIYLVYYAVNILIDLAKAKSLPQPGDNRDTLYFQDNEAPVIVGAEEPSTVIQEHQHPHDERSSGPPDRSASPPAKPGQIESTGGVVLKDLFRLVQADVLQLTKAIPY